MDATVVLRQAGPYRFTNAFGAPIADVQSDLPPPLGGGTGPSPEHFLAAAVANCLSASLLFSLSKFKEDPAPLSTKASAVVGRNAENRMRVQRIEVTITLGRKAEEMPHLERALATFEDYCTVTASVRQGIPVQLEVRDADGRKLK